MEQILYNKTRQVVILEKLRIASNFSDRFLGLLLHKNLAPAEGLLIQNCSSIHTLFMRFAIDCFFLDENLKVLEIRKNLTPHKLVFGKLPGIRHVLEVSTLRNIPFNLDLNDILEIRSFSPSVTRRERPSQSFLKGSGKTSPLIPLLKGDQGGCSPSFLHSPLRSPSTILSFFHST